MRSVRDARSFARTQLTDLSRDRDFPVPSEVLALEVDLLMGHVVGCTRAQLLARLSEPLSESDERRFLELVSRRLSREPVAYLTGVKEFYGIEYQVSPAVLIPRPETEFLVERAVRYVDEHRSVVLFDVGTGSGAIVLSILSELQRLKLLNRVSYVCATDSSLEALKVAQFNALKLGFADRLDFFVADLIESLPKPCRGASELYVSNPPYVPSGSFLATEIVDHEPHQALFSGPSGLDTVLRLIDQFISRGLHGRLGERLETSVLVCEIGGQGLEIIRAKVEGLGVQLRFYQDLSGIDRFVEVVLDA